MGDFIVYLRYFASPYPITHKVYTCVLCVAWVPALQERRPGVSASPGSPPRPKQPRPPGWANPLESNFRANPLESNYELGIPRLLPHVTKESGRGEATRTLPHSVRRGAEISSSHPPRPSHQNISGLQGQYE